MGSDVGQSNERPVHRVWISSFNLAAFVVTNAQFAAFLAATQRESPPACGHPDFNHPRQPVVAVSWFDAVDYCAWLAQVTGRNFRLPTEAEWEGAARGGLDGKLFPWGDEPPELLPDYATRWRSGPECVGNYAPNGYGLYGMCENVHEWCADWYDPEYYSYAPERDPPGPSRGIRRVSRGGSWRHRVKVARCGARSSIPPSFKYADYGFRVACDIEEEKK